MKHWHVKIGEDNKISIVKKYGLRLKNETEEIVMQFLFKIYLKTNKLTIEPKHIIL